MSEEQDDSEILELTEDMTSGDAAAGAEPKEPASAPRISKRPSSPFALLVDTSEQSVREVRQSAVAEKPAERSAHALSVVPVSSPNAVVAYPIRELGESSGSGSKRRGGRRKEEKAAEEAEPEKKIEAVEPEKAIEAVEPERAVEEDDEDESVLDLDSALIVLAPTAGEPAQQAEVPAQEEPAAPQEESQPAVEAPVGAESMAETGPPAELYPRDEDGASGEQPAMRDSEIAVEAPPSIEHPFDFGTPEMVFDAVDHEPEAYEELDDTELQEEPDEGQAEVDSVEIDLAEAEDLTAPIRPAKAMPVLPAAARGKMKRRRKRTSEWWMHIFDDDFMLLAREPSKWGMRREVDFVDQALGVAQGSLVLDLACGMGLHAVAMAKRNYRVVGVDLSLSMLARAGENAQEAGQKINFVHGDMRDLGFDRTFDAVYCIGTSFGFFDEETNRKVLEGVHRALKPGAVLLLELVNRDFVLGRQPNLTWFEGQDVVCMEETDFNYINSRLYVTRQLIVGGGVRQARHEFSLRLYSLHEVGQILHSIGFAVNHVSGHTATPGCFFGADSARMIIRAERRA